MSSSIREIARCTGLSTATVSLALRDKGRMSPATREKIRAAAQRLGYQPLPQLSRALSLARQPEKARFRETLALLIEFPESSAPYFQAKIQAAAMERAESMGFKLESFELSGKAADHRRLSRILLARGIRGAIVCPRVKHRQSRLFLNWPEIAAVEIGRTIWFPDNLHKVERSVYHELIDAFHLLKKAGFRRLGLAIEPTEEKMRRGVSSAAFLMAQQRLPSDQRIPPFASSGPWNIQAFKRWLHNYRPEVLIIYEPVNIPLWLQEIGLEIPRDISVFCTNAGTSTFSGLRSDLRALGESCVEMLSLLLERNELGLRPDFRSWLVKDHWQEGQTLRLPIGCQ